MTVRFTVFDRLEEVWMDGSHTSEFEEQFFGSAEFRRAATQEWIMDGVAVYVPRRPDGCPDPDTIWTPRKVLVVAKRGVEIPLDCRVRGFRFFRERVTVFSYGQTYWRRKVVAWEDPPSQPPVMRAFGGCSI